MNNLQVYCLYIVYNDTFSYLPTPRVQKSGDIQKSLHRKNVIFDMSEYSLKITRRPSECSQRRKQRAKTAPTFDWLISDQLQYSTRKICINLIALFYVFRSRTAFIRVLIKSTPCFIFLFDISKITKLMKNFEKGHGRYFPGDLVL